MNTPTLPPSLPGLLPSLEKLHSGLLQCRAALVRYVEGQRARCPWFYLLPLEDILHFTCYGEDSSLSSLLPSLPPFLPPSHSFLPLYLPPSLLPCLPPSLPSLPPLLPMRRYLCMRRQLPFILPPVW